MSAHAHLLQNSFREMHKINIYTLASLSVCSQDKLHLPCKASFLERSPEKTPSSGLIFSSQDQFDIHLTLLASVNFCAALQGHCWSCCHAIHDKKPYQNTTPMLVRAPVIVTFRDSHCVLSEGQRRSRALMVSEIASNTYCLSSSC